MKRLAVLTVIVALAITTAVACSDDEYATADDAPSAITVTLSDDSLDLPDEIAAGVVTVTVVGGSPETEVDFSRFPSGTTEAQARDAILSADEGSGIPEILEANAGVIPSASPSSIVLDAGTYFVTVASENEATGEPLLLIHPLTVTGTRSGTLPETDGVITAREYGFTVDINAGDTFTFANEGPDQLHHAVLVNFGDLDPDVVKENLPALLASEDGGAPPPALAVFDPETAFIGGSAVFSSGLSGTFTAPLESGNTYAVICFINDRQGGAPHALAYGMYETFRVE